MTTRSYDEEWNGQTVRVHERDIPLDWEQRVELPMKLPNMANAHTNSSRLAQHAMKKKQRAVTLRDLSLMMKRVELPVVVTLVRVSQAALDAHDNLRHALKAVADGVADWLGTTDRNPMIIWRYGQITGKQRYASQKRPGYQAAIISIRSRRPE